MPELPEVETVKRGLEKLIIGKKVTRVYFDWPKSFPNTSTDINSFLIGSGVTDVRRRAKVLIIDLDTSYSLVIHLKMTGQLVYVGRKELNISERFGAGHPSESLIGKLPDKSTHVIFTFKDDSNLYFNDQRKFGWIRLIPTIEIPNIDFFKKVGPEPLADNFTNKDFIGRFRRRNNTTIKAALLDQTVIAGVGNIYADESLWGAKIHPTTKVASLTDAKLNKLFIQLRNVLHLSIEKGGSTDRNYVNAEGKKGSYIQFAQVFRRENQPCYRCGLLIIKTRVAGRGTHLCPKCQIAA
ncbi:MAG: bifunctional DNA-formamidopyrimidine glycosylase/DNA-(apurinic or apyrimidinic site) lyase [Patescibacteria group bacterium]